MKKLILFLLIISTAILCGCKKEEENDFAKMLAEYREAKVASFFEENKNYKKGEIDVAFIGDSLTDGYNVVESYPQYKVVNRGIGGDTTFTLEDRLQVSLYDIQPKVVVMLIGANNFATMFENYENILKSYVENLPNSKIILLSLTSMSGEWGKNNQLAAYNNVKIKKLAEKYSFEFVDLYSPLMNLETGEIFPEYTTDGGHLTKEGYTVFTENITPAIEKQLAAWQNENS